MEDMSKSKILIIGATGYIGKYLVMASIRLGHPTFILVRQTTLASNTEKADLIQGFIGSGVTTLSGDINNYDSLLKAIKQVDVVFSAIGHEPCQLLADQVNIISAIKEAGNIKRYFPSEFGFDVDRLNILEPAKSSFGIKVQIRKAIKEGGIPFTFVCNNFFATYFLSKIGQVEPVDPTEEKVNIMGDGNTRAIFVREEDVATYAIKAVDDPRTVNKILYIRPAANFYSVNELVSLWEKKIGRTIERIYIPKGEVLKKIQDSPNPLAFVYAVAHASFIKGEQTNYRLDLDVGIEATELYPEVKYTTVAEIFEQLSVTSQRIMNI